MDSKISRAETRLGIMKGYCNKFSRKTLLQIYTCYIRPILEYGDVVWINLTMGDSEKLEDINRRAIRLAIGAKLGTKSSFLYQESALEKLTTGRRNSQIKMMFKIMNNKRGFQLAAHVSVDTKLRISHIFSYSAQDTTT